MTAIDDGAARIRVDGTEVQPLPALVVVVEAVVPGRGFRGPTNDFFFGCDVAGKEGKSASVMRVAGRLAAATRWVPSAVQPMVNRGWPLLLFVEASAAAAELAFDPSGRSVGNSVVAVELSDRKAVACCRNCSVRAA